MAFLYLIEENIIAGASPRSVGDYVIGADNSKRDSKPHIKCSSAYFDAICCRTLCHSTGIGKIVIHKSKTWQNSIDITLPAWIPTTEATFIAALALSPDNMYTLIPWLDRVLIT